MRVTKYPQSCLVVEKGPTRVLIDPGSIAMGKHKLADFGKLDAVLYTHEHQDHFDQSILDDLKEQGIKIYANASTAKLIGEGAEVVQSGQKFKVGEFEIEPFDLAHCPMGEMGGEPPQNTGYFIDGYFFDAGDGYEASGRTAKVAALAIAGPTITLDGAVKMATDLGADKVIPIHYDYFKNDPHEFAARYGPDKVIVLGDGEETEV